jgi:hypothetical protein
MGRPVHETQRRYPMSMYPVSARVAAYLVRLLLNLDDMFFQILRVLDPRFRLEECFFLWIQFQQSAVEVDGTETRFGFTVQSHSCRPVNCVGVWRGVSIGLRGSKLYKLDYGARGPRISGFSAL